MSDEDEAVWAEVSAVGLDFEMGVAAVVSVLGVESAGAGGGAFDAALAAATRADLFGAMTNPSDCCPYTECITIFCQDVQ